MVWTCEKGRRTYRQKNAERGAARQGEKRKTKEEVHKCGEGGHARDWCGKGRRRKQSQMETDESLWRTLKRAAERRRRVCIKV